ncbi:TetR/AcrR family transcriptional regulator [Millisia brevis]|uniref:TetR/AcrR family transcriptional regulator n=1 Tax=Millisia brevis TaxID=264148 RepID=UPI000A53D8B2|nr:TetR/AcrR family transcriptional regulator [Millisia brevis]
MPPTADPGADAAALSAADAAAGTDGRRYGGADADERRARRRLALVAAGLELFGELGYHNVSVKKVCERAGLTQRYFYESFADRKALLIAVYDHCVAVTRHAAVAAAGGFLAHPTGVAPADVRAAARASLGAYLRELSADPRRARVVLVEVVGIDPAVESVRLRAIHEWADLILTLALGGREPSASQRLAAVGLVGAFTQLLVDWYFSSVSPEPVDIGTTEPVELSMVLDVCVEMIAATHERLLS